MKMTGLFHLTLLPSTDDPNFEKQITEVAFANPSVMQSTRITRDFDHRLLKKRNSLRQYVWQVDVDLMTDHDYDFAANITKVQDAIDGMAVITAIDVFERVG